MSQGQRSFKQPQREGSSPPIHPQRCSLSKATLTEGCSAGADEKMPPASPGAANTCSGKNEDVVGFSAAALPLPAVEEAAQHQQMRHRQPPTGTTHHTGVLSTPEEASLPQQQHVSLCTPQSGLQHSMSIPRAIPPRRKRGFS